jgi:uncharacterized phage protein (TIGR02218 family)
MQGLVRQSVHRHATLWEIQRADDEIFRYTDHQDPLEYDGETFQPTNGLSASARLREDALRDRAFDAMGVINSNAISHDDLRAGRFDDAVVVERVVDWMYPWMGLFQHQTYTILEISFDGDIWHADVIGNTRRLRAKTGRVFSRDCDAVLGDDRCGVNIATYTETSIAVTWVSADYPRKRFRGAALSNVGYFDFGTVTWETGSNSNLEEEVKTWVQADREVQLQLAMPFDIEVGDTFTLRPGCQRIVEHCKGTSGTGGRPWPSNINNFRGFPTVPGTDVLIRTPNAK